MKIALRNNTFGFQIFAIFAVVITIHKWLKIETETLYVQRPEKKNIACVITLSLAINAPMEIICRKFILGGQRLFHISPETILASSFSKNLYKD